MCVLCIPYSLIRITDSRTQHPDSAGKICPDFRFHKPKFPELPHMGRYESAYDSQFSISPFSGCRCFDEKDFDSVRGSYKYM